MKPKKKTKIDFNPVIDICEENINKLHKDGYMIKDIEHWIYEAVLESVYGKDIWKWIDSVME